MTITTEARAALYARADQHHDAGLAPLDALDVAMREAGLRLRDVVLPAGWPVPKLSLQLGGRRAGKRAALQRYVDELRAAGIDVRTV